MTTATGEFQLTDPRPRGCGDRARGGIYACSGFSPDGRPIEHFLFCPPHYYGEKFHRAPKLADVGAGVNNGMITWIGAEYYQFPSDFIEEAKLQGVSRRIPATWPIDKLTLPAWLVCVHAKARLMNALSMGMTTPAYCPKVIHSDPARHDIGMPICLGRSWELAPETNWTSPITGKKEDEEGHHTRRIGSTRYAVFPPEYALRSQAIEIVKGREAIVTPAYEPGVFAIFPLTHFEYVLTKHREEDEKVLGKNTKIPMVGVEK